MSAAHLPCAGMPVTRIFYRITNANGEPAHRDDGMYVSVDHASQEKAEREIFDWHLEKADQERWQIRKIVKQRQEIVVLEFGTAERG